MHNPHDHSYKLLFSNPEMVRDLLTGFVQEINDLTEIRSKYSVYP